jgi:hypothetical protein
MRLVGDIALVREKGGTYTVLVGKSEGEKPLGRPRLNQRIILK